MASFPSLSRREFVRAALLTAPMAAFPSLLAACSKTPTASEARTMKELLDARLAAGAKRGLSVFLGGEDYVEGLDNYVAFGLVRDRAGPVTGADAKVWIATGAGGEGVPAGPFAASWGGYARPDAPSPAPQGVNAADLTFEHAGVWKMLVEAESQGARLVGTSAIQVKPKGASSNLVPGQRAIASKTPTVSDHRGVNPICTRTPPCDFHRSTLAEAIRTGRPSAFIVATPKFCTSRTCGPNLEELIAAAGEVGGRANFVHAEVYRSDKAEDIQRQAVSPTFQEWKFQSEPWLILIDPDGTIAERFEGPVVASTIRSALKPLLG